MSENMKTIIGWVVSIIIAAISAFAVSDRINQNITINLDEKEIISNKTEVQEIINDLEKRLAKSELEKQDLQALVNELQSKLTTSESEIQFLTEQINEALHGPMLSEVPKTKASGTYLGDKVKYLSFQNENYLCGALGVYNGMTDVDVVSGYFPIPKDGKITDNTGNEYSNYLTIGSEGQIGAWAYVEYALNGDYSYFNADLALAEVSKDFKGAAKMTIFGDDEELLSEAIKPGLLPKVLNVDLTGITKLRIHIETTDDGGVGSQVFVILGDPFLGN